MTFAYPRLLWIGLATMPALGLFLWWSWRARRRLITVFVPRRLQESLTIGVSPRRAVFRACLLIAGILALFVALARPRYGAGSVEVRQRGLDLVVAIDTSRSMLAEDGAPGVSRLQRAKFAALDLARLARNDRMGLVAFAGSAFLQCPLTVDDEAFRQSVDALDTSTIPQGGTSLGPAIHTALDAFTEERANVRALVLLTDGEEHERGALDAAKRAEAKGLRIFTVGVGTARGEIVRLRDNDGNTSYLKDDQGNVVKSSLNESLLRDIAALTGGLYVPLQGPQAMAELFARGLEPLPREDLATRLTEQYHERFQWPLALALLLLIVETVLPERARTPGRARPIRRLHPTLAPAAATALFLATAPVLIASPRSALREYKRSDFSAAQAEFERLAREKPTDPRLRFNAGAAAYRAGEFPAAAKHFQDALASRDLRLQEDAFYNLGNSQFQSGASLPDPEGRRSAWEQSLKSFEAALKLDSANTNAAHNLDYVRSRLEELKQEQQQQQQKKENQKEDGKDDEKKDDHPQQDDSKKNQQEQNQQKPEHQQQPDQQEDAQESQPESNKPDPSNAREDEKPQPDNPGSPSEPDDESQQQSPSPKPPESDSPPRDTQSRTNNNSADLLPPADAGDEVRPGQMTPQQALRLLDASKGDEKLVPLEKRRARVRVFKDW